MKEADQIIGALNTLSLDTDELAKAIASEHPTLQQDFMRVCMKFIKVEAEKAEDKYDLRNEATVKVAKKIVSKLDYEDFFMPRI